MHLTFLTTLLLSPSPLLFLCAARQYLEDLRAAAGGDDEERDFGDAAARDEEVDEKLRLDALEVSLDCLQHKAVTAEVQLCDAVPKYQEVDEKLRLDAPDVNVQTCSIRLSSRNCQSGNFPAGRLQSGII